MHLYVIYLPYVLAILSTKLFCWRRVLMTMVGTPLSAIDLAIVGLTVLLKFQVLMTNSASSRSLQPSALSTRGLFLYLKYREIIPLMQVMRGKSSHITTVALASPSTKCVVHIPSIIQHSSEIILLYIMLLSSKGGKLQLGCHSNLSKWKTSLLSNCPSCLANVDLPLPAQPIIITLV